MPGGCCEHSAPVRGRCGAGAGARSGAAGSSACRRPVRRRSRRGGGGPWCRRGCCRRSLCVAAAGGVTCGQSRCPWPPARGGGRRRTSCTAPRTEEALPAAAGGVRRGLWKQQLIRPAYRRMRPAGRAAGRPGTRRDRPAFRRRHKHRGFVATRAARGKIQGMPYGNCLLLSDGPINNSTGIPFFYVTPKDNTVTDLLKNPMASLTLPETDGNFCRKNVIDPEDPRCARLTLMGQMVMVPPEEVEFAKQAVFSRHPVVRKWPRSYEWFFMKMNIEHIWLQSWYGEGSAIAVEEYLKAVPSKG
ncbi:protein CREG2 [Manacus vitellinus]|uniref:protein CREG2 n=1 Tax=Manacus vitellinus TaxID=328815 RepID=UPI00115D5FCB|nr:protein CREG2 [Manacus vitellinus]